MVKQNSLQIVLTEMFRRNGEDVSDAGGSMKKCEKIRATFKKS